jgi:uncharacterized protein
MIGIRMHRWSAAQPRVARPDRQTGHQIAVLIIPTLAGEQIESFCLQTTNERGLGRKGISDGILVCLAPK